MSNTVRVWDLPTRLFHWALATCVLGMAATAYAPGSWIEWHARLGYAVLSLLLFRIVWGFVGGRWSRFATFVRPPSHVLRYLRGKHPDHLIGHNPLGALSVLAMLLALLVQVMTGLVSDDEIAFTGPLNRFVSSARALQATAYHQQIGKWIVLALIAVHVAAILFYLWRRRENLIGPMVTGDKAVAATVPASRDDARARLGALLVFAGCASVVAWLVGLAKP